MAGLTSDCGMLPPSLPPPSDLIIKVAGMLRPKKLVQLRDVSATVRRQTWALNLIWCHPYVCHGDVCLLCPEPIESQPLPPSVSPTVLARVTIDVMKPDGQKQLVERRLSSATAPHHSPAANAV